MQKVPSSVPFHCLNIEHDLEKPPQGKRTTKSFLEAVLLLSENLGSKGFLLVGWGGSKKFGASGEKVKMYWKYM